VKMLLKKMMIENGLNQEITQLVVVGKVKKRADSDCSIVRTSGVKYQISISREQSAKAQYFIVFEKSGESSRDIHNLNFAHLNKQGIHIRSETGNMSQDRVLFG